MSIKTDYQKLEPGNAIRLLEIDGTAFGTGDVLRFHAYNIPYAEAEIEAAGGDESKLPEKSIWWQGKEYKAWPSKIEGIEASSSGSSAQPKLTVANLDGSVTALCLAYDDMLQAKVTIHDTLAHFLDAKNFPEGNPRPARKKSDFGSFSLTAKALKPTNRLSSRSAARWTCRAS